MGAVPGFAVARAIANAPVDDEPVTEEARALGEAREWLKQNKGITHEPVLADILRPHTG